MATIGFWNTRWEDSKIVPYPTATTIDELTAWGREVYGDGFNADGVHKDAIGYNGDGLIHTVRRSIDGKYRKVTGKIFCTNGYAPIMVISNKRHSYAIFVFDEVLK